MILGKWIKSRIQYYVIEKNKENSVYDNNCHYVDFNNEPSSIIKPIYYDKNKFVEEKCA
ncbi:hypothetical protein PIROE2DRAFT_16670 [Piromyces sp. E2]|nr:hypothetical protein PIROE2DRAFT_16670 [Piromyces sp. E2]|eukprot:OUM58138.1 hypothetical protein PIROE2DRAFT_16670 [Piromyces sp. E2]